MFMCHYCLTVLISIYLHELLYISAGSLSGRSPPTVKPRVTLQTGRSVAPSASSVMVASPAFSTANRSDYV